jgi:hypothetical protein
MSYEAQAYVGAKVCELPPPGTRTTFHLRH